MGNAILFAGSLQAHVEPWCATIGSADARRLRAVVSLATEERTRLNRCLRAAFPRLSGVRALAALRMFRKRLNDAASKAGLRVRWEVDTKKRTRPAGRFCWFSGEDVAVEALKANMWALLGESRTEPFIPTKGFMTSLSAENNRRVAD